MLLCFLSNAYFYLKFEICVDFAYFDETGEIIMNVLNFVDTMTLKGEVLVITYYIEIIYKQGFYSLFFLTNQSA